MNLIIQLRRGASGLGVELDVKNKVVGLITGGQAEADGLVKINDAVVAVDGVVLGAKRLPEVLAPVDASAISEEELSAAHDSALHTIEVEADAIIERHTPQLPEGAELRQLWSAPAWPAEDRAAAHLQMASLALSAQRTLLSAAQADDRYLLANSLKVRGPCGLPPCSRLRSHPGARAAHRCAAS